MSTTFGLCRCGCGQPTRIAPWTDPGKGWVKGEPIRFIKGHHLDQRAAAVGPPPDEDWRPVVGHEGKYLVSSDGRAYSLLVDREMTLTPLPSGHLAARMAGKPRRIHRLVLESFVGPCPPGHECLHRNDDPTDNRLENLRWGTRSENLLDRVRNGRHHEVRKTHCPQGHEYTEDNTYRTPDGRRECLTCRRVRSAEFVRRAKCKDSP